jgi:hypothetical protein
MTKYISVLICGLAFILLWNAFLIHRDAKLFKAYDACTQFTHHPDCPYRK